MTSVSYVEAAEYAAWTGCRLPSEDELEWAARGDSGRLVPEGLPKGSRPTGPEWFRLHGVREVKLDRTEGNPPIFGLYGNAAELTLFRYRPNLIDESKIKPSVSEFNVYRRRPFVYAWGGFVVRSGLVPVEGLKTFRPLGYEDRVVMTIDRTEPNVGFRRARSVVPRFRTPIPLL